MGENPQGEKFRYVEEMFDVSARDFKEHGFYQEMFQHIGLGEYEVVWRGDMCETGQCEIDHQFESMVEPGDSIVVVWANPYRDGSAEYAMSRIDIGEGEYIREEDGTILVPVNGMFTWAVDVPRRKRDIGSQTVHCEIDPLADLSFITRESPIIKDVGSNARLANEGTQFYFKISRLCRSKDDSKSKVLVCEGEETKPFYPGYAVYSYICKKPRTE